MPHMDMSEDLVPTDIAAAPPKKQRGEDKSVIVNGLYIKNRNGTKLCEGFQTGACGGVVNNRCAKDHISAHQCAKCLDNSHGQSICGAQRSPEEQSARIKAKKANSVDKGGKGKGKKGGKNW